MLATNLLSVLFSLTVTIHAQVPFFGRCPDIETVPDFDAKRYLGKWYEAERYFAIFEFGGKCVTANYNLDDNGSIDVFNEQISALTGMRAAIQGKANQVGRSDEAKLSVNFPSLPVNFDAPYWVVGTDYDNFSVVWSCNNFGIFNTRNAWILTRENHPSLSTMEKAYEILDKKGISRAFFIKTDQESCPIKT